MRVRPGCLRRLKLAPRDHVGIALMTPYISTLHATFPLKNAGVETETASKHVKDQGTHLRDQGGGQQDVVCVAHAHSHACEAWGPRHVRRGQKESNGNH